MGETAIIVLDDPQALFVRAAEEIAHVAGEAVCMSGEFNICLAGGSTPAATYELIATRFEFSIDWKEVRFFWGDERCVPPDDPASNFGMARRTMLDKLDIPSGQIHRILGEREPQEAACLYEEDLRAAFSLGEGEMPRFDLVLLGLGENRHTASLFPASRALEEKHRMVLAVEVDAAERHRITLTPAAINNAARVMFIACGDTKAEAVRDVLEGPRDPRRIPAQVIDPTGGETLWLLDKAAARLLSSG